MPNQPKLLDANPQLGLLNGLHQDTANFFRETELSNYLQISTAELFEKAADKSLFSIEIENALNTDQLRIELSASKYNYLQLFNLEGLSNALDLSQDLGGVAHYLGSQVNQVDSIKVDVDRARIGAKRCAELQNITHISEDIEKLNFPAQHYDLIVISDLGALGVDCSQISVLFSKLQSALNSNGVLAVNTANSKRVGKWLDPRVTSTSHSNSEHSPYLDLYTSTSDCEVSRSELSSMIQSSGLGSQMTYASYAWDGTCRNLFSEHYLAKHPNVINHFYRIGAIENSDVNEYLMFRKIHQENDNTGLLESASSYLVLAGTEQSNLTKLYNKDFAHFPGTGRKPQWRAITHLQHGSDKVVKTSVFSQQAEHSNKAETKQIAIPNAPVVKQETGEKPLLVGRLLIEEWLQAALNLDHHKFRSLVTEYTEWLAVISQSEGFAEYGYDALPFNILVDPNDETRSFKLFDTEWSIDGDLDTGFVLFRALFWFAFQNKSLVKNFAEANNANTLKDFVNSYLDNSICEKSIQAYAATEEHLQAQISNSFRAGSIELALTQTYDDNVTLDKKLSSCQITWGTRAGEFNEASSLFLDINTVSSPESKQSKLIRSPLTPYSKERCILRIDPIAIRESFTFNAIRVLGPQDIVIWELSSAQTLAESAELHNVLLIENEKPYFQALNSDPHFNFDLSSVEGIETATGIELELSLLEQSNYEKTISTLSRKLAEQSQRTERQANTLNHGRAELEFLHQRLEDAKQHRSDLNALLIKNVELAKSARVVADNKDSQLAYYEQMQMELYLQKKRDVHRVNLQIENINDQLIDQLKRNDEMHHFLMIRPSTRAKRLLSRTWGRLKPGSKKAAALDSTVEAEPVEIEPIDDSNVASIALDQTTEDTTSNSATEETVKAAIDEQNDPSPSEVAEQESRDDAAESSDAEPNIFPYSGELIGQNIEDYQLWIEQNSLSVEQIDLAKKDIEKMLHKPIFSILVPIYNTDPEYLLPMIRSVQAQIYPHWQLCLVDDASPKQYLKLILEDEAAKDPRITLVMNQNNQGISLTSNDALAVATGDYIALLDHDDEISIDALYENAKIINRHPEVGLIYSDEDKMDMQGNRLEPYFKPDYSPDLLDTNNYVCHFTVIKKAIADEIGGFSEGLDGSQDHDIILRSIEKSDRVVHIPKILYHWRKIPGSTAVEYDSKSYAWEAGRVAVERNLQSKESGVRVEFGVLKGTYRVHREIKDKPLVSIVIPFKDQPKLLNSCLESIRFLSSYMNFEVVGVSNNSELPETFEKMRHFEELDERIRFVEKNIPFNFSAICNFGVSQAKGDYVVLLNNDIEIKSNNWIEDLLQHAQRPEIGAVGGKLLYPDGRIQHAGVVVGMVGAAGHPHKFFPDNHIGYHGRLQMVYNVSAVTGAMLMVNKQKYLEVGGLDEDNLAVAYNDIDFCLKLMDKGYLNIFTPHAKATHHESVSRGYEDTPEKMQRLLSEQGHFLETWKDFIANGDPFYNPNLSLENERFSLRFKS